MVITASETSRGQAGRATWESHRADRGQEQQNREEGQPLVLSAFYDMTIVFSTTVKIKWGGRGLGETK